MTAQEIFKEYSDKYPFLKELSKQERSVIICMLHEVSKEAYEYGCKITSNDILNRV